MATAATPGSTVATCHWLLTPPWIAIDIPRDHPLRQHGDAVEVIEMRYLDPSDPDPDKSEPADGPDWDYVSVFLHHKGEGLVATLADVKTWRDAGLFLYLLGLTPNKNLIPHWNCNPDTGLPFTGWDPSEPIPI